MVITGEQLALASFALALTGAVTKALISIGKVLQRVTVLETKTELFWGAISKTVGDLIKQPIHFRKDELVDKFNFGVTKMPKEELLELDGILDGELPDLQTRKDPKALAYVILRARIHQVLYERDSLQIGSKLLRAWHCLKSIFKNGG